MGGRARRVLVADGEERAVLAAARGLAAAGYAVGAAAATRPAASHWSRAVAARFRVPDARADGAGYVDALARIAARGGYDAVVPGTDLSLELVSAHRDRFPERVRLGLPPHERVLAALDKAALHEAAARAGLPGPEARRCADADDAARAAAGLGYPVVVKSESSFVRDGRGAHRHTGAAAATEQEVRAAAAAIGGALLVQRLERGALTAYAGVRADGRLLALAVTRALRTWPPGMGSTSLGITVEPDPETAARVEALLAGLGWEGVFQLQLLDCGGRLVPIDLNPRPYGSLGLAIAAGANIPAIWCDWLLDGRAPAATVVAAPGVRWRWEHGELGNLLTRLRDGRLRDAASLLAPEPGAAHAFFRASDPAPLAARALEFARSRLP